MSIATRIEAIEQHITDDYSVLELAGADLTNVDKNIQNLKQAWEERLLYFLANGTDVVWNNWSPKVTGTGENITLNNTVEAKMKFVCKGNTSQNGEPTPNNPVNIDVVTGNNSIIIANNDNTQSQTYTINLGSMELCKIGDYQDYLYKANGNWYKHETVGKTVITDANKSMIKSFGTQQNHPRVVIFKQDLGWKVSWDSRIALLNKYKEIIYTAEVESGAFATNFSSNTIIMWNDNFTDLATAQNLLVGTEIYMAQASPTEIQITDTTLIEQLNNLEKAYSYNTQTNISQTNADKPFILDVVALGELEI